MTKVLSINTRDANFDEQFEQRVAFESNHETDVAMQVAEILGKVRREGDAALIELSNRFDQLNVTTSGELEMSLERCRQALESLPSETRTALETAADRIETYHRHQRAEHWQIEDSHGNRLGQRVTPIERVGIYVPGGKASYPSSVLMNAIPAKVAGVKEIIMVSPTPRGEINELVLAAAALVGVSRVFCIGGAHAVGALTFGTETVPKVDKIVGPGNKFVAEAKRQVFGRVGLDMVAGPSEVLIIADDTANPEWVAMDLFAQAEHDEDAQSILISNSAPFIRAVQQAIFDLIDNMPRKPIIEASLSSRGLFIEASSLDEAIELANRIAPEHLELAFDHASDYVDRVHHAGAIFVGHYTPESFGDYCAGPNHVLPTSGTARFSSPLGVYDFQKRTSVIECTQSGAQPLARIASHLADCESLIAHGVSARNREVSND